MEAGVLARITEESARSTIGNPIPVMKPAAHGGRACEIDLIPTGRLVTGWVRGSGPEQYYNNVNPAYNREYSRRPMT